MKPHSMLLMLLLTSCCPSPRTRNVYLPPRMSCLANPPPIPENYRFHKFDATGDAGPVPRCGELPCAAGITDLSLNANTNDIVALEEWTAKAYSACAITPDGGIKP